MRTDPINRLDSDYMKWRNENLSIYTTFKTFAAELLSKRKRFGMRLLLERVRWEVLTGGFTGDYKLNNNYVPYIGRDLIHELPGLNELISFRRVYGEVEL